MHTLVIGASVVQSSNAEKFQQAGTSLDRWSGKDRFEFHHEVGLPSSPAITAVESRPDGLEAAPAPDILNLQKGGHFKFRSDTEARKGCIPDGR